MKGFKYDFRPHDKGYRQQKNRAVSQKNGQPLSFWDGYDPKVSDMTRRMAIIALILVFAVIAATIFVNRRPDVTSDAQALAQLEAYTVDGVVDLNLFLRDRGFEPSGTTRLCEYVRQTDGKGLGLFYGEGWYDVLGPFPADVESEPRIDCKLALYGQRIIGSDPAIMPELPGFVVVSLPQSVAAEIVRRAYE